MRVFSRQAPTRPLSVHQTLVHQTLLHQTLVHQTPARRTLARRTPARQKLALAFTSLMAAGVIMTVPGVSAAQVSQFEACSIGALANCATIRLTATAGAGAGGSNLFEIALGNLGSKTTPTLPTSIYFLSLLTGKPPAISGTETDALATPMALGGATVSNPTAWSVFEGGDAIYLSAPGDNGIGGCATFPAVGGFGQMSRTCGLANYISFSFSTVRAFDPRQFTLAGMEFVAIAPNNAADSCNDVTACTITPQTITPEPSTVALLLAGLSLIVSARTRRRSTGITRHLPPTSKV